ncbi:helix-turn-helix domain-containing protein [Streptomyces sp. NPDC007851]|uniref:TetR/AcrR family transcriptional regulator n=1 Tax=Streptomyces sp. NPDC007851 TaxID=3155008 RepID=UPI0033C23BEB
MTDTAHKPQLTAGRGAGTREAIMAAAERLYAEYGLSAVTNRQIGEAAGQSNTTVASYPFGSKTALVRAIMTRHGARLDAVRQRHVTEHLDTLGVPSWQARFAVRVLTDPLMRALVTDESLTRDSLRQTLRGPGSCPEPVVSAEVRGERADMARHLITHTCAEYERSPAEGTAEPGASWQRTAQALEDALVGLLTAPSTT